MDDKLFENMRILRRNIETNACTYCHEEEKVLEHSIHPDRCPERSEPPIGGWHEPHKDDL